MTERVIDKAALQRVAGRSLGRYIALVHRTSSVVFDPPDTAARFLAETPFIMAMWHGQFLMVASVKPDGMRIRAMVAQHGDGEVIAEALRRFDADLIRGAGAGGRRRDRGGSAALRAALRSLEDGISIGMTADVPPGPARRAGPGIITLARLSGRPILPIAVATSRYWALDTWSRMTINLPFSRMAVAAGRPVAVARDATPERLEEARIEVEASLNEATARAYRLAGTSAAAATPQRAGESASLRPGFKLGAYRTATRVLSGVAPLILSRRVRLGKEDAHRLDERVGIASRPRPEGTLAWIHAASVGETNAVLPVIQQLAACQPELRFLLTTGTRTSAEIAAGRLGPGAVHQYVPLDSPAFVARFLDHWRPDMGVFVESEIWPNLILEAAARNVPLALVNARMSNRSFNRWRRNRGLSRPLFGRLAVVLAQNEKLARRYAELGAPVVRAIGNLKIDAPAPPVDPAAQARLRSALAGRPVLVAASTHEGEDAIVAESHRRLASSIGGLCTIIAPRHPERGAQIRASLAAAGFAVARRSEGALPTPGSDVYIADTIGELGTFYSLAPVAFIGGSLVDRGGQNPIEAIRHGAAVLTGPSWYNFTDSYRALLRHNGVIEVRSADDLAAATVRLLSDAGELARVKAGAEAALSKLSGALEATVAALRELLPETQRLQRAS
jgi:3-deoxy-D-manno-octulosonic-acid transferase